MEIKLETIKKILDKINDTMGFYGFGREYNDLAKICKELEDQGVDVTTDHYQINKAINTFHLGE